MLTGEATNTNFIDFGLTWSGLEPTIYRTRDEHANHYTTDEPTIYRTRDEHANHYTTDAVRKVYLKVEEINIIYSTRSMRTQTQLKPRSVLMCPWRVGSPCSASGTCRLSSNCTNDTTLIVVNKYVYYNYYIIKHILIADKKLQYEINLKKNNYGLDADEQLSQWLKM